MFFKYGCFYIFNSIKVLKNAEIYRKFGFEFVMDKREMIEKEHRRKPSHSVIRRKAEKSDLVKLSIFAQQAMDSNHRIALSKDLDYFKQMLELVEVENGEIDVVYPKESNCWVQNIYRW